MRANRVKAGLAAGEVPVGHGGDSAVYRQALLGRVAEVRRLIGEGGLHG